MVKSRCHGNKVWNLCDLKNGILLLINNLKIDIGEMWDIDIIATSAMINTDRNKFEPLWKPLPWWLIKTAIFLFRKAWYLFSQSYCDLLVERGILSQMHTYVY